MIRQHFLPESLKGGEKHFRWRGGEVSRIEGLSDGVFALALTLLTVSLEVPNSFDELAGAFKQVPAFLVCFAILAMLWYYHYLHHRRYGLEDGISNTLNLVLLFLVLLYVYPLKFLFSLLFQGMIDVHPSDRIIMGDGNMPTLMLLYSFGAIGVFLVLFLMTLWAYRKRAELELDARELVITKGEAIAHLISIGIAVVSVTLVLIDDALAPWSGLVYFLMGPVHGIRGYLTGSAVEKLAAAEESPPE